MDLTQLFISNLKKWRKLKGLSQEKIAEKCNGAHSYIRQLESGKGHPSFAFIGKMADALRIEPYQLFYDETAEKGQTLLSRYMESVQTKLLESMSSNIQIAFDELRKYQ